MSNRLVTGDYAIVGRKGSDVNALVRLVSYLQGFKYHHKGKDIKLIDTVKNIITELTKVSSYLVTMQIDSSNIS